MYTCSVEQGWLEEAGEADEGAQAPPFPLTSTLVFDPLTRMN